MSGKGVSVLHPKQNRRDQMVIESEHDPYHKKQKLKENTVCTACASVFKNARWSWESAEESSHATLCPACQRIRDKVPAGYLTISKAYLSTRKDEIVSLIHHVEIRERQAHPMKRIMQTTETDEHMEITFTDPRLARNIGDAIKKAYGGNLDYQYTAGEFMLRVTLQKC